MRKCNTKKETYIIGVAFLVFFLFQFWQIFQFKAYIQADDFAYIANSAYFAGYNWNPYIGNMTPFYNIGFPIFGTWAFWLFHDPVSIYQALLFVIISWQLLLMYLVYRMGYEFLGLNKVNAVMIALLYSMGSMAPQCGVDYMAEVPFAFFFVLSIYLMLKAERMQGKKKAALSAFLGVAVGYSYAVHTRFLVLIGVVFLVIILYRVCFKKNIVNYIAFFAALALTLFLVSNWMGFVQDTLYKTTIDGRIIDGNDAVARLGYIGEFLQVFTDWEYIKRFLRNVLSLAAVYTLLTGGMIWFAGISMMAKTIEIVKKKAYTSPERAYLILAFCATVSFVGMNILTAINGAINTHEYKWLTYHRYAKPFVGLIFIAGLIYFWNKNMKKKEIFLSYAGTLAAIYCSLHFTMRMLQVAGHEDVSAVGWMYYYFYREQTPTEYFLMFAGIAVVVSGVFLVCFLKKKQRLACLLFLLYSVILTCSEVHYNVGISDRNYDMVDKTYKFVKEYEEQLEVPIYFMQTGYSGRLRFVLYDVDMNYVLTEEEYQAIDFENALVLCDKDYRESWETVREDQPKYIVKLDEYEYAFTSSKEVYEMIKGENVE